MFLLRTITGICKLCHSEHGAALVVEPPSPELQPSPAPIAVSEPGDTLEIPSVVRTVIASRLVQLYTLYCSETGFQPLGRLTLFNILKVSSFENRRKSLNA